MNRRQVGRNAGNDRAADDLGDIRHVELEARRGARSPGTGRVEPGRRRSRPAGPHLDRQRGNLDEKLWESAIK